MALIKCEKCGREISDKAQVCPHCGASVSHVSQKKETSVVVKYDPTLDVFYGTMSSVVKLAMNAIQQIGWTIEMVNENIGLITFKTGISWGSWSGVVGSLNISEISQNTFQVTGTGKQNISRVQLIALDFGESKRKVKKVIKKMQELTIRNI